MHLTVFINKGCKQLSVTKKFESFVHQFFPLPPGRRKEKEKKNMYNIANMVTTAKAGNKFFFLPLEFCIELPCRRAYSTVQFRPGTNIMSRLDLKLGSTVNELHHNPIFLTVSHFLL